MVSNTLVYTLGAAVDNLLLLAIPFGIGVAIGLFIGKNLADDSQAREMARKEATLTARGERLEREMAKKEEKLLRAFRESYEERQRTLREYHESRSREFSALVTEAREFHRELQNGMLAGRKWLAGAFAEFVDTRNCDVQCWLADKLRPAIKAAMQVAQIRRRFRDAVERMKLLEYQVESYEEYFPFLVDYRDAILDECIDLRSDAVDRLGNADPALSRGYLSRSEYDQLSTREKFQLALDRYWERNKSRWEIGRVYERFMGYLYERDGWRVSYQGILKGYEDFGRDLICRRANDIHVVQCKCWSKEKVIREKHIFQLFGTTVLFRLHGDDVRTPHRPKQTTFFNDMRGLVVLPVFATTTALSEDATAVAEHLGIRIRHDPLRRYPMIKCNVNPATQEKIYHLPFDQQYDNTNIGNVDGEFYADTIAEAEEAGFRRACRWRGYSQEPKP